MRRSMVVCVAVLAAQALGASHTRVVLRHVLPNCIAPELIWFAMGIGTLYSKPFLFY